MEDQFYLNLIKRLNQNQVKLPPSDPVVKLVKMLFTIEQAEFGAIFPLGAHTLKALAEQLDRDEMKLADMLEEMVAAGLIFTATITTKGEKSETEYSLVPWVPGLIEHQYLHGKDTEVSRKVSEYMYQMQEGIKKKRIEAYKKPLPPNADLFQLRTLTVEKKLVGGSEVAGWEQISEILNQETSFAAGACYCRTQKKHMGEHCKLENLPQDACMYFGKVADYMVEHGHCHRYSRQEMDALLKSCGDAGLVPQINNFMEGENIVLCNCCGCCCTFLHDEIKKFGARSSRLVRSNFRPLVQDDDCIGCGVCVDICQVDAIEVTEEMNVARVDEDYCVGCGQCADRCPEKAISMVRIASVKPPRKEDLSIVGLGR